MHHYISYLYTSQDTCVYYPPKKLPTVSCHNIQYALKRDTGLAKVISHMLNIIAVILT